MHIIFYLLIIIVLCIVYYLKNFTYKYWKKRGVPGPEPTLFVGNLGENITFKKAIGETLTDIYYKYQNFPFVGVYSTITPTLLIRDPELIKDITVKEFGSFHDNSIDINVEIDPLFGRNPFTLKGEQWKIVRAQLAPCFSSGKMKMLYPLLKDISERLAVFIGRQDDAFNGVGLEAKELCTKFTLNNVATCAFGLEGKCFEDPNSEFRQIAKRFLTPGTWSSLKIVMIMMLPSLSTFMSIKFTPKDVEDRLMDMVRQTLKYREENNIVRNDFLHMMNQLKASSKDYHFTDVDITAHAAGFFGDGFETSSLAMSFFLFHLANNPSVQSKLRDEINRAISENDKDISYELVQGIPYLDAALFESLRLQPPLFVMGKRCTSTYTYHPDENSSIKKPVIIEKGTAIILPVFGLQHDPTYFEDPESYIPERFMGQNKEKITKYTFMPFGEGPRTCLGQRFGMLQIKAGVIHILKNYELTVNKKTKFPFKYDPTYFMLSPLGGIWLDFKKV